MLALLICLCVFVVFATVLFVIMLTRMEEEADNNASAILSNQESMISALIAQQQYMREIKSGVFHTSDNSPEKLPPKFKGKYKGEF